MRKKLLYGALVIYLLNFAGKQLEENKRLQMENGDLKRRLNENWDRTALN